MLKAIQEIFYIPMTITMFIVGLVIFFQALIKYGFLEMMIWDTNNGDFYENIILVVEPYANFYTIICWIVIIKGKYTHFTPTNLKTQIY